MGNPRDHKSSTPFPLESGAFYGLLSFKYFERSEVPGFDGCGFVSRAPRQANGDGRRRDTANLSVLPGKVETETVRFIPRRGVSRPPGPSLPSPVTRLPQSGGGSRAGYWYTCGLWGVDSFSFQPKLRWEYSLVRGNWEVFTAGPI